jgi:DMSO/TMAO reductase YedYZ molybdopterin-dependent catalytic subunit
MAPLQAFVDMTGATCAIEWSMQGQSLMKSGELNAGNYGVASTTVKFDCTEGMVGQAFSTKKPILLKDVSAAPDEFVRKGTAMEGGLQSIAFLPYEDSVIELGFSEQQNTIPTKVPSPGASTEPTPEASPAPTPEESAASETDKEVKSFLYIPSEDASQFQADTLPVLQGHLSKKNTGQKRWAVVNTFRKDAGYDRKYFILRDMHLLWWDTQEHAGSEDAVRADGGAKCKGVLNLVEAPLRLEVVTDSDTEFLLIPAEGNSTRRSYQYIVRDSEHSRAEWMEKLHAHLAHAARVRVERQAPGAQEGRLTASRIATAPFDGKIRLSTQLDDITLTMPPRQDAEIVDERDADTPDKWVKRHKDMVRLTGRHPFNSEPPLKKLQEAGWITPPALHVVRNHGAVPQLNWSTHKLKVLGTPAGDIEISMDDLVSGKFGPVVSFPVSFICAGNRRKEQNMTKKTIGFNWGCAAVGNSIWTGVRLCDVLAKLGVVQVSKQHRHVQFAGPLGELPKGDTGEYGTSIDMGWALDRERDVLLAF